MWAVSLLFWKWWQLSEYRQHPKMLSNVKFDIVINLYQVILYLTPCEAHIVSPLSSNTSTMGPIYKSTLLFGLLASKSPQFEKYPSRKIPVIGVQMLNQPTLFPSSSLPNEKIYFRFISMFLFWNGLFSSHFWVGGLFLLHSVLNCSLSKRSRVRN